MHSESQALQLAQTSNRIHYFILSSAIINHRFSLPINRSSALPRWTWVFMSPTYGGGQPAGSAATWELQNGTPSSQLSRGRMNPTSKWNPTSKQTHRTLEQFHVIVATHIQDILWGFLVSLAVFRKSSTVRELCPHSPPCPPLGLGLNSSSMTSLAAWPWEMDLVCLIMSFSICKLKIYNSTFLSGMWWWLEGAMCTGSVLWLWEVSLDFYTKSRDNNLTSPLGI